MEHVPDRFGDRVQIHNTMNQLYSFVARTKIGQTQNKDDVRRNTVKILHYFFHEWGGSSLRFLTLPSSFWIGEKYLRHKFKYRDANKPTTVYFVGCEKVWALFTLGTINLPDKPGEDSSKCLCVTTHDKFNCQVVYSKNQQFALFHLDVFEYMDKTSSTFNCIWLDTTSPITFIQDKILNIKKVIRPGQPV